MTAKFTPDSPREAHLMACAIGRDAANQRMRAAGRSAWDREDANVAADVQGEMYGVFGILSGHEWLPAGMVWARNPEGDWQPAWVAP